MTVLMTTSNETPHRFAVRFMNLAAFARQLTRRVETLEERSPLGFPRPMGAARS